MVDRPESLARNIVNQLYDLAEVPVVLRPGAKVMCSACGLMDWPCPSLDCPEVPANPEASDG